MFWDSEGVIFVDFLVAKGSFELVERPPYFPDLASIVFQPFPKLNEHVRGKKISLSNINNLFL